MLVVVCWAGIAGATTGELAQEIAGIRWQATYAEWSAAHPSLPCVEFRSASGSLLPDEEWSYRCERSRAGRVDEWFFYVLDTPGAPAARLAQFRSRLTTPNLPATLAALTRDLAGRFGSAEIVRDTVAERGAAFWKDVHRWAAGQAAILVYRDTSQSAMPPSIDVLVRHRSPVDARQRAESAPDGLAWLERSEAALDAELRRALGDQPDVVALLARVRGLYEGTEPARPWPEMTAALERVLDGAERAAGARRAPWRLAADLIANSIQVLGENVPGWDGKRAALAKRGLHWDWSPLGATWSYRRDLLPRVWKEFPATPWGEWAFVLRLQRGWDTGVGCAGGPDEFRGVIREGERFLATRPRTPHRVRGLFAVALAHETWWSLAHAEGDTYADAKDYQTGRDAARRRAISAYDEIARLAPASDEAYHARRVLGRLRLGLATNERTFFCVYD
ncbi:MAG: hypothetical protein HYU41_06775 [Candidatus Rokubacteria bacterium]|nr:hypothetical protein [Candidatus Rokubacteria bacterium]